MEAIIVEYEVNGQKYRKKSDSYSNVSKPIGTIVQIKYNPNNPLDAIWVNDRSNIIIPIIGGLFTVAGIVLVIIGIKKRFY